MQRAGRGKITDQTHNMQRQGQILSPAGSVQMVHVFRREAHALLALRHHV